MNAVAKLLSISSEPLSGQSASVNASDCGNFAALGHQLLAILGEKNGFYAFESALHVFPIARYEGEMTLGRWNSFGLWRHEYGALAEDKLFFAENAFGDQFCLHKGTVCSFDAETAKTKSMGHTLEEWAQSLLLDYEYLTAYPMMHQWQLKMGVLPVGKRLIPKIPFVLGGEFSLQNLCSMDATSVMKSRGNLARQISGLPDGAQVEFRIIE